MSDFLILLFTIYVLGVIISSLILKIYNAISLPSEKISHEMVHYSWIFVVCFIATSLLFAIIKFVKKIDETLKDFTK